MKLFLEYFIVFIVVSVDAFSTNYYFSSSAGNDSYSVVQARNPSTPWKSIEKLNASMNLFKPGDSILFKRGNAFVGQIVVTCSGELNKKIVFGAYGNGSKPILKGVLPVAGWTKFSGNIWVAPLSTLTSAIMNLMINGISQQIGRYPNADASNHGYLKIDSHSGQDVLTSSLISSSTNWTGGEAVVRTRRWILDRVIIKAHSGSTITLGEPLSYDIFNDYGFFIQNHLKTLDKVGEWYCDTKNKKIYLFYLSDPNSAKIEVAGYASAIDITDRKFITIENLDIIGSENSQIILKRSGNVDIKGNSFSKSGTDAILMIESNYVICSGNTFSQINNNAITVKVCDNIQLIGNTLKSIAVRAGMGSGSNGQYIGIYLNASNTLCENNIIDSIGYNGIDFKGNNISVRNNFVKHFCLLKDDGAGIYAAGENNTTYHDRYIEKNIIINGIGNFYGTNYSSSLQAHGIYLDNYCNNVKITNNTISDCSGNGIYVHNAYSFSMVGNTLFNNAKQLSLIHDDSDPYLSIKGSYMQKNILFSKNGEQMLANYATNEDDIEDFGDFNNNYYCRPVNDFKTIRAKYLNESEIVSRIIHLGEWQSDFSYDVNSVKSPYHLPLYNVSGLIGLNKVLNSDFEKDLTSWNCWSPNYNCQFKLDKTNKLNNNSLNVIFAKTFNDIKSLVYTYIGEVSAGRDYILRFSVVSSLQDKLLCFTLKRGGIIRSNISSEQFFIAGTDRKEYEFLISADSSDSNARLDFIFPEDMGSYWIDNIEFYQANVQKTATEDSVRLFFNPSTTQLPISNNSYYIDAKGFKYHNFTLQPFSSLVLVKVPKEFYDKYSSPNKVTSVKVSSTSGISSISSLNGTLQLKAIVSPETATNKSVTWSVQNGTGKATITSGGLVTAISDGTITAVATANDGSGIKGTLLINITGQVIKISQIQVSSTSGISSISSPNGTLQLKANVSPETATNKSVTWSVQNSTGKATITSGGLVTAISDGTITAVATANDGSGIKGTLLINITGQVIKISQIQVSSTSGISSISSLNGTLQLKANVSPETATNKSVTWSVQNGTGKATITAVGLVAAISDGTITAVATANDGSGIKGTLLINITGQVIKISQILVSSAGNVNTIMPGDSIQLYAEVLPDIASNKAISWSVENETGQATITSTGLLHGLQEGLVNVYAQSNDGTSVIGSMTISIIKQIKHIESILVSTSNNEDPVISVKGGNLQMVASITPIDATNQALRWSLEEQDGHAIIDENGKLTAISDGLVKVIADAQDGSSISGTCMVEILNQGPVTGYDPANKENLVINYQNGRLSFKCFNDKMKYKYYLYSMTGVLIHNGDVSSEIIELDTSSMPHGVYIIQLISENFTSPQKVAIY